MKTQVVLKRKRFKDKESDKTKFKSFKHLKLYMRGNEEGKSLDKFGNKGEGEDIRYIFLLFIASPQKELNRPKDLGKRTKSLNQLIYILKIG